jgi:hypothetical protein
MWHNLNVIVFSEVLFEPRDVLLCNGEFFLFKGFNNDSTYAGRCNNDPLSILL